MILKKIGKVDLHLLIAALMDDKGPWLNEDKKIITMWLMSQRENSKVTSCKHSPYIVKGLPSAFFP